MADASVIDGPEAGPVNGAKKARVVAGTVSSAHAMLSLVILLIIPPMLLQLESVFIPRAANPLLKQVMMKIYKCRIAIQC